MVGNEFREFLAVDIEDCQFGTGIVPYCANSFPP